MLPFMSQGECEDSWDSWDSWALAWRAWPLVSMNLPTVSFTLCPAFLLIPKGGWELGWGAALVETV